MAGHHNGLELRVVGGHVDNYLTGSGISVDLLATPLAAFLLH